MKVFVIPKRSKRVFEIERRLYEIREAIENNGDESVIPIEYCPFAEDLSQEEIERLNRIAIEGCDGYYSDDGYDEYAESLGKVRYFVLI